MSMIITASWREWIDWDAPGKEPLRLREDAPQEEKEKFEEWKKQKEEERRQGIWKCVASWSKVDSIKGRRR